MKRALPAPGGPPGRSRVAVPEKHESAMKVKEAPAGIRSRIGRISSSRINLPKSASHGTSASSLPSASSLTPLSGTHVPCPE